MSVFVDRVRGFGSRTQQGVSRLVGRPLFWAVFVLIGLAWPIARTLTIKLPPKLPVLTTVPDFSLTDQHGQPFGSANLRGRVWVANFIFTRCATVCPLFTEKMGKVQHRVRNLGTAIHLVSFSVDPEHDTPATLEAYAKSHRVSPRMWSFLTGAPEAIKRTVTEGLRQTMGGGENGDFFGIFHGSHFVLVDAQMHIRGFYDSSDADAVDRVVRDAGLLVNRGG